MTDEQIRLLKQRGFKETCIGTWRHGLEPRALADDGLAVLGPDWSILYEGEFLDAVDYAQAGKVARLEPVY